MYLNIMINRLNLSLCLPKRPPIVPCLAIDLTIKLKSHLLKPVCGYENQLTYFHVLPCSASVAPA